MKQRHIYFVIGESAVRKSDVSCPIFGRAEVACLAKCLVFGCQLFGTPIAIYMGEQIDWVGAGLGKPAAVHRLAPPIGVSLAYDLVGWAA